MIRASRQLQEHRRRHAAERRPWAVPNIASPLASARPWYVPTYFRPWPPHRPRQPVAAPPIAPLALPVAPAAIALPAPALVQLSVPPNQAVDSTQRGYLQAVAPDPLLTPTPTAIIIG
jgi:hypothetical protein